MNNFKVVDACGVGIILQNNGSPLRQRLGCGGYKPYTFEVGDIVKNEFDSFGEVIFATDNSLVVKNLDTGVEILFPKDTSGFTLSSLREHNTHKNKSVAALLREVAGLVEIGACCDDKKKDLIAKLTRGE